MVRQQYDSSVSATDVALFAACPRKYYLERYLRLAPGEPGSANGQGTGAIELGLAVHQALAGGARGASPEVAGLVRTFEQSELGLRAGRASRLEREFDFLFYLPELDVLVSGQIDLWFEEGGEIVLVDYKTDRDESSSDGYALQLRLYALALERHCGRRADRACLFYLRTGNQVDVKLDGISMDDGVLDAARDTVRRLRDAQESREFPLNEGDRCRRCAFAGGLCPTSFF
jgi:CRISPR/Cas system-associated exonuclease Cas4 (RecB family)